VRKKNREKRKEKNGKIKRKYEKIERNKRIKEKTIMRGNRK